MRYSIFICLLVVAFSSVNAQSKDTTKGHSESANQVFRQPNDSTPMLTAKDLQELVNLIQEYPAKYANPITQWLQARYQLRAQEYAIKPKKP
jgi:hypothetical protein